MWVVILGVGLILLGHLSLCITAVNRFHALGMPRPLVKAISLAWLLWLVGLPLILIAFAWRLGPASLVSALFGDAPSFAPAWVYSAVCLAQAILTLSQWGLRQMQSKLPPEVTLRGIEPVAAFHQLAMQGSWAALWRRLPGNQVNRVQIAFEHVASPTLPPEWGGLRIVQITDLHMTERWTVDYFRLLAEQVSALEPDLVVLTGDVCDDHACIAWIQPTLGLIHARVGKFFILGNHDPETGDVAAVAEALRRAGFAPCSDHPERVAIGGKHLLVSGDERPWFCSPNGLADLGAAAADWRLLLVHSPDVFADGVKLGADLILAGHTHGGQVRLPILGPLMCPSRYGVHFALGWFRKGKTLMRVSSGSGSLFPLRLGCPPEIVCLELNRADASTHA